MRLQHDATINNDNRHEHENRSGGTWYIGAMTDWNARDLNLDLSFLGEGDYEMTVHLAPGGGYAAKIVKK